MAVIPALVCERLAKDYGKRPALRGVSLAIAPGEVYGLAGPNGAGKSTLIGLAAGLLRPTAGTVRVLGAPAGARPVGLAPQEPALYPWLSGRDNLLLLCPEPTEAAAVAARLGLVDLRAPAAALSGGQRRRLALAVALGRLVPDGGLCLVDEPSAGLDAEGAAALRAELETASARGAAVVLASHEWPFLGDLCRRVGVLVEGRLVEELGMLAAGDDWWTLEVDRPLAGQDLRSLPSVAAAEPLGPDPGSSWRLRLPLPAAGATLGALVGTGVGVRSWAPEARHVDWRRRYAAVVARHGARREVA